MLFSYAFPLNSDVLSCRQLQTAENQFMQNLEPAKRLQVAAAYREFADGFKVGGFGSFVRRKSSGAAACRMETCKAGHTGLNASRIHAHAEQDSMLELQFMCVASHTVLWNS
jgi:hypothetical protein